MKKKLLIYFAFGVALLFILIFILAHYNQLPQSKPANTSFDVLVLLHQADSLAESNPYIALITANKIMMLAQQKNDTVSLIKAKIILGKIENSHGNVQLALHIFNEALQAAKKINAFESIGLINIEIGQIYYKWGDYDKSLPYFSLAKEIAKQRNFHQLESNALNHIGKYYRIKGENEKSLTYYQLNLDIARKLNDKKDIALSLTTIGKYYISEGDISKAFQSYLEAYHIVENLGDLLLFAEICNHLAGIYLITDRYEKSLEFNFKALQVRTTLHNSEGMAKSYINLGKTYEELKKNDTAYYYFSKALEICEQIGYKKGTIKSLISLGKLHLSENIKSLANKYLQKAYQLSTESGYDMGLAETCLELGNLNKIKGNYEQAKEYYLLSLKNCKETNIDELLRDNYKGLFECYFRESNTFQALKYHILLLEKEKNILNVENNRQTAMLNLTFDTEHREEEEKVLRKNVELNNLKIKQNRIFIWLTFTGLCVTIILCFLIYSRFENKRQANLKLENLNATITEQNNRLKLLNGALKNANYEKDKLFSIISHELRNPLYWFQNITEMLSQKFQTMTPENIKKSILALDESAKNAFHLMDNLLQWSRSRLNRITPKTSIYNLQVLVDNSTQMFKTILDYREISFSNNINPTTKVSTDQELFACVIRNLVSNAIKYTPCGGTIDISCSEETDICTLTVSDTGKGINSNVISKLFNENNLNPTSGLLDEKGSGLGLKLCKEFVDLNGGKIWIKSKEGSGTQIYFTVKSCRAVLAN